MPFSIFHAKQIDLFYQPGKPADSDNKPPKKLREMSICYTETLKL